MRQGNAGEDGCEEQVRTSTITVTGPRGSVHTTVHAGSCEDGFRDIYNAIKPQFTLLQNNPARLGILGLGLALVEWRARPH